MQHLVAIIKRNKTAALKRSRPATALSPQAAKLLDYLSVDSREITQMVALTILGIGSLTARVGDLRRAGYKIKGTRKHEVRGGTYTSYRLIETPHQRRKKAGLKT